ncbi:MAG: DUF2505 domain-containing protein [Jatrophihabitans sp.]
MKITRVMQHDIDCHTVYEMSHSKEFQDRKCADAGALSWSVQVTVDGDTAVVRTRRKLPTVGFPPLLRKVMPSGVTSTETIAWSAAAADSSRTATLDVDFHGAPARMSGTITLTPGQDGGACIVVDAEFKAIVPIIGGRIEKLAAPIILSVIEAEEQTGRAWVADVV